MPDLSTLTAQAPAKVNLYLHVKRKRDDGYHDLDSLVAFCDFGDEISLSISDECRLKITGPFANTLSVDEKTLERTSHNIVAKTLWALADYAGKNPSFEITLTKNIPLGAGLGGGSADAAALARILCEMWAIDSNTHAFQKILFDLGADVPVCFYNKPCRIQNAGEIGFTAHGIPSLNAVLIHPNTHCSTANVFEINAFHLEDNIIIPDTFESAETLIDFLKTKKNTLTKAAIKNTPTIETILETLNTQDVILLSRMTGSGSACFGVFGTKDAAQNAAKAIKNLHPEWWVQAVKIS